LLKSLLKYVARAILHLALFSSLVPALSRAESTAEKEAIWSARRAADAGSFERAAALYETILTADPNHPAAITGWCRAQRRLGAMEVIEPRFSRSGAEHPASAGASLGLGLGRLYAGNLANAERAFLEAERLYAEQADSAGQAEARSSLGVLALMREEGEVARDRLLEALEHRRRAGDPVGQAETLVNLATAYEIMGELQQAEERYLEARRIFEENRLPSQLAIVLVGLGNLSITLGDLAAAHDAYAAASRIHGERGDLVGLSQTLVNLAHVSEQRAQYEAAIRDATRAIETSQTLGDTSTEALARVIRGNSLLRIGETDSSREDFRAARLVFRKLGNPSGAANALTGLGNVLMAERDVHGALGLYRESLRMHMEHEDARGQALDRFNIGGALEELGYWAEALESYAAALSLRELEGVPAESAGTLVRMGRIESLLGRFEPARNHLLRALDLARQGEDRSLEAVVEAQLGHVAKSLGRLDEALSRFQSAAQQHAALREIRGEAQENLNAAEALRLLGRSGSAREHYETARRLYVQIGDQAGEALVVNNLAILALHAGDPSSAVELTREVERLQVSARDDATRVETLVVRGQALDRLGRRTEARLAMEAAVELENKLLDRSGGADLATALQKQEWSPVLELTLLLARQGLRDPAGPVAGDAFEVFQLGRARALRRLLRVAGAGGLAHDELLAQWNRAQRDIARSRTQLQKPGLTAAEQDKLTARLERSEEKAASVLRQMEKRALGRIAAEEPRFGVEALQRALGPDESLVSFALGEPRSFAWVVTRSAFRLIELPGRLSIETEVDRVRKALDPLTQGLPVDPALAALGGRILSPLLPYLPLRGHVWIVPDDSLLRAPLDALPLSDGAPLLSRYESTVLPSAVSLLSFSSLSPRRSSVLVFGDPEFRSTSTEQKSTTKAVESGSKWSLVDASDPTGTGVGTTRDFSSGQFQPLSGAEREVEALKALYGKRALVYAGRDAKEEAFKTANLRATSVIHFSTHAFVDRSVAERSAVVLALDDDPGEDGFLTLQEILGLRIGPSVVVLAACETAGEKVVSVEGLLGLARAFLAAGAQAVVATLWSVDDESTLAFSTRLHRELRDGANVSQAVAAARRGMMASGDTGASHARAWSPFILIGDGRFRPFLPIPRDGAKAERGPASH